MHKEILVIGGTRLFGIALVRRCLAAGHRVTIATRGRAADPFGAQIRRIVVDRGDRDAMIAAFMTVAGYDLIYDQVCYSAHDAAIATEVFAGRAARYVMASTIEVYRHRLGVVTRPFDEDDAALAEAIPADDYATGKRQAEAVLAACTALPSVRVRIGHVLAGPEDFTGRLASYVRIARAGTPLRHTTHAAATSFIGIEQISALLRWVGDHTFIGPLNAASHARSAVELHRRIAAVLDLPPRFAPIDDAVEPGTLSPFDYAAPYVMSTARATDLGCPIDPSDAWLDDAILRHAAQPDAR